MPSLRNLLDDYERVSGQAINYTKSGIYFSKNVSDERREEIKAIMGVQNPLNTGRYLGLPSLVGRSKKEIFMYIKDRLWKKLQGWRNRKLSKAGKEILIKAAAQAVPTYCMTTFFIPVTLLDELHIMMNKFWWGNSTDETKGIKWMRWEKLCVSKVAGGRGFWDLHLFNLTLLGKMAWRLIREPEALVCRILKAKYYPQGDFLTARPGGNPSFTWYSIHACQDLIRCGSRWKVGDGSKISVWGQPWVQDEDDSYIRSARLDGYEDMKVQELILEDSRQWDVEQLQQFLMPEDVRRVLNTPLPPSGVIDGLSWMHELTGIYIVKSGYKLASSITFDRNLEVEGEWNLLWGLKVPPKVKDCLWRIGRDCLPHKVNLFTKKVVEDKWCVLCGSQFEDVWHVFFNCRFALECWEIAGLRSKLEAIISEADSFLAVFFGMLRDDDRLAAAKFGMVAWQIWKERNSLVWDGTCKEPLEAVYTSTH